MVHYSVIEINDSHIPSIEKLAEESITEEYPLAPRLIKEWKDCTNTFSERGEKFWGLFVDSELIAVGGLNIDPYVEDVRVGRVRDIFVAKKYRGQGLSKVLLKLVIDEAKKNFGSLRLSTKNQLPGLSMNL